jgi:xylono-1,5-lactonase
VHLELLASGFGVVEGPRAAPDGSLYFSDAARGGVFSLTPDGAVTTVIPGRPRVGGLALHEDGGLVLSGPDVVHWKGGRTTVLFSQPDVSFWNDLEPDFEGRLLVGSVRRDITRRDAEDIPGSCFRINIDGSHELMYSDVSVSNGIAFSPDGSTLYHCDSLAKGLWVHNVSVGGSISNRRLIGRAAFDHGVPDGLCVDIEGNLWVAHVGGRRVVKLNPLGEQIDEIAVPAKAVTSVAFAGPSYEELIIVTADNMDEPGLGGSVYRTWPGVSGMPTPPARIQVGAPSG